MDIIAHLRPLTIRDVIALGQLVDAAAHGRRVARLREDGEIAVGTARSIGDTNGCHPPADSDIREEYLRVTLTTGLDVYWPISELMPQVHSGEFSPNYQR